MTTSRFGKSLLIFALIRMIGLAKCLRRLKEKSFGNRRMSLIRIRPLSPSSNETAVKFSSSDSSDDENDVT